MQLKGTYTDILKIAAPIMVFQFVQNIIGFTDTIFLGRVGVVELSACGITSIYYLIMVMIGYAVSRGAQIMIARFAGEEKPENIGAVFDTYIGVQFFLSLILFALLYWGSQYILPFFIQSPDILEAGLKFLQYRSFGIFFSTLGFVFLALYSGIGRTTMIVYVTLAMALSNMVLNYSLIFGAFGFPKMGIAGSGLASTIAEAIASIIGLLYAATDRHIRRFHVFKNIFTLNRPIFNELLMLSYPLVIQFLVGIGGWFLLFTFIENMGQTALGVSTIAKWVYTFWGIPTWGLASAVNSVVSNLIGQNKQKDALLSVRRAMLMGVAASLILGILLLLFPAHINGIFTDDEQLIAGAGQLMPLLALTLLVCSMASTVFNGIIGVGATRASLLIEMIAIFIYLIYAYTAVNFYNVGLPYVWAAELIYWGLLFIGSQIYFMLWKRKQRLTI